MIGDELEEKLAEHIHDNQWCGWLEYQKELGVFADHPKVNDWVRKSLTPYKDLSDEEKERNRIEARKILVLIEEEGFLLE